MNSLGLAMIVRDEAARLPDFLDHHRALVEQVVVVDTGSRDDSADLAREAGALVVEHAWSDDFAAARNAGASKARGEYLVFIDADVLVRAVLIVVVVRHWQDDRRRPEDAVEVHDWNRSTQGGHRDNLTGLRCCLRRRKDGPRFGSVERNSHAGVVRVTGHTCCLAKGQALASGWYVVNDREPLGLDMLLHTIEHCIRVVIGRKTHIDRHRGRVRQHVRCIVANRTGRKPAKIQRRPIHALPRPWRRSVRSRRSAHW